MDYNKRRWLERIQHQQQEEEPRDVYPIEHTTYFSQDCGYSYTAIAEVYSKYTIIELYKTIIKKKINAPFWVKFLLKILDESNDNEPIVNPRRISNNDSVHHTIQRMIVDYEIPLYQKWMAQELEGKMKIDYEHELRQRRQRLVNIDREPEQKRVSAAPGNYAINDFFAEKEPEKTEDEKKEQRIQELAERDGVDPAKYRNLKPFQVISNNKKSS